MRGIPMLAFCLLVWAVAVNSLCEEERGGPTPDVPSPASKCFKEDLEVDEDTGQVNFEKNRPVEGIQSCDQYVRCDQNLCTWQVEKCENGLFFRVPDFDDDIPCVEPLEADCAASLFGPNGRKVTIENPKREKVLFDCQGCLNNNLQFSEDSPVVGYISTDPDPNLGAWQWQLIAAKRDPKFYSFAFDRETGEEDAPFKMLTKLRQGKGATIVWSMKKPTSKATQWKIVPNVDDRAQFRIQNAETKQYLVMSDQNLAVFFGNREVKKLVMSNLDLNDPAQLWKFNFQD